MADEPLTTGGTYTFRGTFLRDGSAWNLTTATVTFYLRKPDGTLVPKSATVTNGAGGIAEYTTLTSDLTIAGRWSTAWKVVDGSVTQYSRPKLRTVFSSP